MKCKDLLIKGKAKSVYATDTKGKLIVEFRDDITAFDGGKKDVLKNKGTCNAEVSAFFFEYLEHNGVKTHFFIHAGFSSYGRKKTRNDPA